LRGEKISIRVNRGLGSWRASTTWPSTHSFLSVKAAKLIRTWNAIRVFSGRTVTGPAFSAAASSRLKVATTAGSRPVKWSSRRPLLQECD